MSETVALTPERAQTSEGVFAATAGDRFDDAVVARGTGEVASARPRLPGFLRRPLVLASLAWLVLVIVAAVWPAVLAPGDPLGGAPADNLQAPSWAHWFGTDQLGRDLYTRVVHGTALTVSAAAIAAAALPSPGDGQGPVMPPLFTASQHLASAFVFAARNAAVALPIVCWHLLRTLLAVLGSTRSSNASFTT